LALNHSEIHCCKAAFSVECSHGATYITKFRLFSRYRVRIKFALIAPIADFVRSLRSSTQCRNFLVRGSVGQSAWCFTPQLISQSCRKITARNIVLTSLKFWPDSSKRNEGTSRAYDVEYPFSRGSSFVHYDSHNRLP